MRKNQISIKIERFGENVPKDIHSTHQTINVYADSNNPREALMEAFYLAMKELMGDGVVDGCSTAVSIDDAGVNGQKDSRSRYAVLRQKVQEDIFEIKRRISSLKEDLIAIEHADEIYAATSSSKTQDEAIEKIVDVLDVREWEARRLLNFNFAMLSADTKEQIEQDIECFTEKMNTLQAQADRLYELSVDEPPINSVAINRAQMRAKQKNVQVVPKKQ